MKKIKGRCIRACIRLYDPLASVLDAWAKREGKELGTKVTELVTAELAAVDGCEESDRGLRVAPQELPRVVPPRPPASSPALVNQAPESGPRNTLVAVVLTLSMIVLVAFAGILLQVDRKEDRDADRWRQKAEQLSTEVAALQAASSAMEGKIDRAERDAAAKRIDRLEEDVATLQQTAARPSASEGDPGEVRALRFPSPSRNPNP